MKKNKIFGIGAAVLMILVAMIPAINAMKTDTMKDDSISTMSNSFYDLKLDVVKDPAYISEENGIRTFYVEYKIINEGNEAYEGTPLTEIRIKDSENNIDSWVEDHITLNPSEETPVLSHNFEVEESEYIFITQNKFNVQTAVYSGYDKNPWDNIVNGLSTGWWNNDDPTYEELMGMAPCNYKEISKTINGTEYSFPVPMVGSWWTALTKLLDAVDKIKITAFEKGVEELIDILWNKIPNEFKNKRLGYVNDLTENLAYISLYCTVILLKAGQFLADTWDEFVILANFVKDMVMFFSGNIASIPIADISKVVNAVTTICQKAVSWLPEIYNSTLVLRDKWYEFQDWLDEEYWNKKISVAFKVRNVNDYIQPITVKCRRVTKKYSDEDGDNKIEGSFKVSSEPLDIDPSDPGYQTAYYLPHKCKITVEAETEKSKSKSIEVKDIEGETIKRSSGPLWCFSNGNVYTELRLPQTVNSNQESNSLIQLLSQLFSGFRVRNIIAMLS